MIFFMEQLRYFILKNKYFLVLSGIFLLVILFVYFYGDKVIPQAAKVLFTDNTATSDSQPVFYIEVLGQVKNPGVYAMRTPVLVIQAIELAGGLTLDADLEYVHKVIPLSVMVKPEQKIYIPGLTSAGTSSALQDPGVNLVNLNTSSKTELMDIAGVGDVTANKIISIRPISSWDQVQQLPNLSSTTFQEIKKRAVL